MSSSGTSNSHSHSHSTLPATSTDRNSQRSLPPLPLPVPNPMMAGAPPRVPTLVSFDSISSTASVGHGMHRGSDDLGVSRLPSIRPDGMLLESSHKSSVLGAQPYASSSELVMRQTEAGSPFRAAEMPGKFVPLAEESCGKNE